VAADAALTVMRQAVQASGRQDFVKSCLFRLWPHSQKLLREVSRRLGGEIRLPGDRYTLLERSIRAGVAAVNSVHKPRSRHGYYRLEDWERTVYFGFFTGLFQRAAEVGYCRVRSAGGVWTVLGPPYLSWREEQPGEVVMEWSGVGDPYRTALRLAWQAVLASGQRRQVERRLLDMLGAVAYG